MLIRFPSTWPIFAPAKKVRTPLGQRQLEANSRTARQLARILCRSSRAKRLDLLNSDQSDSGRGNEVVERSCKASKWARPHFQSQACCLCLGVQRRRGLRPIYSWNGISCSLLLHRRMKNDIDFRRASKGRSCTRRSTKAPRTILARKSSLSDRAHLVRLI